MSAHQLLRQYSKSNPSESLAKAVAFVIKDAKDNTPFVTLERIDTELSVVSSPAVLKSGKLSRDKTRQREEVDLDSQSVAARIVLSRLHPDSNYNRLTDMKYAIDRMSFSPGLGISGFWSRVIATATRMVKSRHSSTHFFKVSWNAVLCKMIGLVPQNYRGAVTMWAGGGRPVIAELGNATMTGVGSPQVFLRIDNNMGTDEEYPTIAARRNEAAHRILGPVLQRAIDRNYEKQMQIAAERGLLDRAPQLKALGVNVS